MKLSVHLPEQVVIACTLLPSLGINRLMLEPCQYISANNNIINLNQLIILPWKLQFELVKRNMNTTFSVRKKQKLITLNHGLEQLQVKYSKTWRLSFKKLFTRIYCYYYYCSKARLYSYYSKLILCRRNCLRIFLNKKKYYNSFFYISGHTKMSFPSCFF